ncbi:MAG: glycosyltransferase family 4 protein [Cyanobacteriota bacterium]
MKIAIVNKFFFLKGGQESLMFEEANHLQQNGFEIAFFSMHHPDNDPDYKYSKYFVDHVELSNMGKEYSFLEKIYIATNFIYNHKAAERFKSFLNDFKPDIIHCHGIAHQISPSILKVAKKYNIPVVQTLHDYQLVCPNYTFMLGAEKICVDYKCISGNYYNCLLYQCVKKTYLASFISMLEAYFNRLTGIYIKNVSKFIAPSKFLMQIIINSGIDEDQIVYIPNFVEEYKGSIEISNKRYFLYIGRLSFEKGLKTILNAFKDLSDANLKIIGTGPMETELIEYSLQNNIKNVEFLGFIPRNKIDGYIRACEAIILPSEWYENAPVSIIEAFSMQKPVIASSAGGIPEMVEDGYNGYLFPVSDVESLKFQISRFIDNPDLSLILGKNAYKYYDNNFNKEKHMSKLILLYESLLG